MRKYSLLLFLLLSLFDAYPQPPARWTSADMYLAIRKLNVLGSVLYVAAHPDDENTRLLAFLSKDKMYRTGYLSMTRGDGGQNLIGDEQGIDLGLVRTQELLSARRIDGAEQFFTRAFDFGYSKSPEETFTKWDKEKILSDVVWVIRKFQPDVIITRFPTTGEGGHGHHTASAILANEAFAAAADPSRFPEQLKYVKPWQAKRLLWNTFNFGGNNTTRDDQLKIDVGGYNPLLGKSYGEIAAESRSQHKSQGFGASANRGQAFEYFSATKGNQPDKELFENINTSWQKIKGGDVIKKLIDGISTSFDLLHPEKSVKGLTQLYKALNALPDGYWQQQKLKETKQLIAMCSGLWMEAYANDGFAVQTDSVHMNVTVNNRLGLDVLLQKISVDDFDTILMQPLKENVNVNLAKTLYVPVDKPVTQPYWLVNKMEQGYYNVDDQLLIGYPDVFPSYTANIKMTIEGLPLQFEVPVKYKFTNPVRGELYEPLIVVPPLLVSAEEKIKLSKGDNRFEGIVNVTSKIKNIGAVVNDAGLKKNDQIKQEYIPASVNFSESDKTIGVKYNITGTKDNAYTFHVKRAAANQQVFEKEMHEIKYDHIPFINYFTGATVINRKLDLKTEGKRIGYIIGAGDKVPDALQQMGYEVVLLGDKELSRNSLQQFDAIITGVRAYNTNDWLNNHYDQLMAYVNDGGNLIVQYNTSSRIGPVRAKIGPYDFNISRNRITDENAAVTFLKPNHPVLNYPNKITPDDFKDWIQERSIYHASDFDNRFEAIFSMHDPGEKEDDGSLVIAKYGKGVFVYTGLVFFRELPAGVPGAYRLLANLIALNKKKAF